MKTALVTRSVVIGAVSLLALVGAHAQINLSTLLYGQGFDALGASGSWADNNTLAGWYAANDNAGTVSGYATYANTAGGGTSSSTLYSLGTSSTDLDRALGGAPSSTRYTILGLRLLNDTGSLFDTIQVGYDVEQWSDRGTATISLSYQVFSPGNGSLNVLSGWTTLQTTTSPLPVNATPVTGIGNTTGLVPGVQGGATGLGLQAGDELWLRWTVTKISGQNATHGIDNVVVTVPEPTLAALGLLGLILAGFRRGR